MSGPVMVAMAVANPRKRNNGRGASEADVDAGNDGGYEKKSK